MKLAYFSCQLPYPPRHGGTVDDWRRLRAFKAAGADITLVTWYPVLPSEPRPDEHIEALRAVAQDVHAWGIGPSWPERIRRLWGMRRWPASVSSRVPSPDALAALGRSLDANRPDAVWLDSMHPMVVAQLTARRYGVPLYYRSHNREHDYMKRQVVRATTWRSKLAWGMNLPHLARTERQAIGSAKLFFDISVDDLASWQREGFLHGRWLPPLVEPEMAQRLSALPDEDLPYDVAYLGNLFAPNNVEGVLWFLREVMPLLRATRPGVKVLIAGSQPVPEICATVASAAGVTLLQNAPDPVAVLRSAHVLVNPVFAGSGVNVKSVEMLLSPARIVSAPQGVAGLPADVQACFSIAEHAPDFAAAVSAALAEGPLNPTASQAWHQREQARSAFSFDRAHEVLHLMAQR